jgi:gamma-glutamylcysteine synthetase
MRDGSVSAFDFKTGEKIKDIKTGKEAEGVRVTSDGKLALVPHARASRLQESSLIRTTATRS